MSRYRHAREEDESSESLRSPEPKRTRGALLENSRARPRDAMTGGSELEEVDVDMSDNEEERDWESNTESDPHPPDPGGHFPCHEIATKVTTTRTSTLGQAAQRRGVWMSRLDY